jgi:hypothetical protein
MEKQVMLAGIFGITTIIAIVLLVNSANTGLYWADDYYVRPSGMQMRVESGVVVLQTEPVINEVCHNAAYCNGQATYSCCSHDSTSCIIPSQEDHTRGSCPSTHRSRCQCREDYVAGLIEKYG